MDLNEIFFYQKPDADQLANMQLIRMAAHDFARCIRDCTPSGEDQRAAIRHVREAMFTANSAIALRGAG